MSDNKAQKAASLLGLAKRAGKITSGVPLIIEALRSKNSRPLWLLPHPHRKIR